MNHIRGNTNKTSVKLLIKLFALLFSLSGFQAGAQSNNQTPAGGSQQQFIVGNPPDPCTKLDLSAQEKIACSCRSMLPSAREANREVKKACAEGSLGENCYDLAIACSKVTNSDIVDVNDDNNSSSSALVNAVLTAVGASSAINIDGGSKKRSSEKGSQCPQYTSESYQKQKKELDEDIKKLEEDIAKKQKDLVKDQEEAEKKMTEITEKIQKAQKDLQKDNEDRDDSLRKQISEHQDNMNAMRDSIRKANEALIKKRAVLAKVRIDTSKKLSLLNNNSTKDKCVAEANKVYQENAASFANSLSTASRSSKKRSAIQVYKVCMEQMDIARQEVIEASREAKQSALMEVQNAEEELSDMEKAMDSAGKNLNQIEAASKASKDNAAKAMIQEMQSAQTEMQSIQTNFQKKQMISTQETAKLNEKLNAKNNERNNLGAPPPEGATVNPRKAAQTVKINMETIVAYKNACCTGTNSACDPSMQEVANKYNKADEASGSRSDGRANSSNTGTNKGGGK